MQQDDDESARVPASVQQEGGAGPMDEEAWCQAMVDHAVRTSVGEGIGCTKREMSCTLW